jgi:hypothetical protein
VAGETERPDSFLTALAETLKSTESMDGDLADILSDHILKIEPSDNAVADAKAAIVALAAQRAAPKDEEAVDG